MLYIVVFLILLILILPGLVVIPMSFTSLSYFQIPIPSYSTKWYEKFMENSQWLNGLGLSLSVSVITAILATIIGIMAALAVEKLDFKGKNIFMALMVSPMVIPVVIIGVALYSTFAPLHLTNTVIGLVLSYTLLSLPMVFVTILSGLSQMNENLELAGMSMGSTPIGVFFKITLPCIRSSVISAMLFAFATSLDEVAVSIFVSGAQTKTLPMVMWENMRTAVDPTIAAASTILICFTLTLFAGKGVIETLKSKKG